MEPSYTHSLLAFVLGCLGVGLFGMDVLFAVDYRMRLNQIADTPKYQISLKDFDAAKYEEKLCTGYLMFAGRNRTCEISFDSHYDAYNVCEDINRNRTKSDFQVEFRYGNYTRYFSRPTEFFTCKLYKRTKTYKVTYAIYFVIMFFGVVFLFAIGALSTFLVGVGFYMAWETFQKRRYKEPHPYEGLILHK
jgi:hypothetical protein